MAFSTREVYLFLSLLHSNFVFVPKMSCFLPKMSGSGKESFNVWPNPLRALTLAMLSWLDLAIAVAARS